MFLSVLYARIIKTHNMRKFFTCFFAALGLTTACGQKNYEDADVKVFAGLVADLNVVVLDVRTAEEFAEGHIANAINVDVRSEGFAENAARLLPQGYRVAVYCRSGRRSAMAAEVLATRGYKVVNLSGGILAWQDARMPVTTDNYEVDVFATPGGKLIRLHALMHASIRMEYDGREILIDPVTRLGERTIDYSAMPKADYIFVTHEHADHFDKEALRSLSSDQSQLITKRRCAEMLEADSVKPSWAVMANGDTLSLADGIKVEAVPAYNTTEGHLQFHPKGRDNGFVLSIDGLRLYIAGDTEDIPEMAEQKDIDIAFLPCNQPFTMTPGQLGRAAKMVKPRVLFPYHYGQTDVSQIPSQLEADDIEVRIRHYE